jgi:NAD dependent epimerase/dehydratase family enzyme
MPLYKVELSTQLLCKSLASLDRPPKVLISASAIGYYSSNREDEILSEDDSSNSSFSHKDNFLAQVCIQWEQATITAKEAGIRVVNIRIGIVMDPSGGMLATILPIFKAGLGGKIEVILESKK